MEIEIIALLSALLIIAVFFVTTLITGSPPLATSDLALRTMLATLPARLPGEDAGRIYEFGSGWGGVAMGLADKYPAHKVIGFELSLIPWLYSIIRLKISKVRNVTFHLSSFMKADISDASVVVCYLMPETMVKLSEKLKKELRPGTLVLSNAFSLPGWEPLDNFVIPDTYLSHIYLYEKS